MLTHYTNEIKNLVNILNYGFAWGNSRRNLDVVLPPFHDYNIREPQQFGIVSFTELRPEEVKEHRNKFGKYGIVVSDSWAVQQNAQRVIYVEQEGLVTGALRSIFKIGYDDCKSRIEYPDDTAWTMAYENKAVAGAVVGASLWANLLQLYEYMENAVSAAEREWRIVNPDPYYNLAGNRTEEIVDNVSPPQGWGIYTNVLKFEPKDVREIICPKSDIEKLRKKLPEEYSKIDITEI